MGNIISPAGENVKRETGTEQAPAFT